MTIERYNATKQVEMQASQPATPAAIVHAGAGGPAALKLAGMVKRKIIPMNRFRFMMNEERSRKACLTQQDLEEYVEMFRAQVRATAENVEIMRNTVMNAVEQPVPMPPWGPDQICRSQFVVKSFSCAQGQLFPAVRVSFMSGESPLCLTCARKP